MIYKILEANGVENENIDGAAFNNFSAGCRNGVMRGVLNECRVYISGNSIHIMTGELLIQGFRIKIIEEFEKSFIGMSPAPIPIKYQIISRISVSSDKEVEFTMNTRVVESLVQENLYSSESGVYEVEIAVFTLETDGSISNLRRTIPVITAGENGISVHVHTCVWNEVDAYKDEDVQISFLSSSSDPIAQYPDSLQDLFFFLQDHGDALVIDGHYGRYMQITRVSAISYENGSFDGIQLIGFSEGVRTVIEVPAYDGLESSFSDTVTDL